MMAGHDYWHTPPELFDVLHEEFRFTLDAACSTNNCLATVGIYDDSGEDALVTEWDDHEGAVWCNPPYSKMGEFVYRAWDQCQKHRQTVVLLIPAYTDPAYWWDCIVPFADEIRFLKGRVSFLEHGQKKESARFPSVIVVFRYRRGEVRGFPRVIWWDWKAKTEAEKIPLLAEIEVG